MTRLDAIKNLEYHIESLNIAITDMKLLEDTNESHVQQWISVSEKLPEFRQEVLVTDGDGDVTVAELTPWGAWYDECPIKVVAWMPLPEPPK